MTTEQLKKLAESAIASLSEKGTGRDTYIFSKRADEEAVLELLAINDALQQKLSACMSRCNAAVGQAEALRKDAERWRTFLATRPPSTHDVIREAIDAAMKETP